MALTRQNYTYKPLTGRFSIRVLELQPSRSHDADIQCSLREVSIDPSNRHLPRYNALSYVWGAEQGTIPVSCDGSRILVTPNCESALRYLRSKLRPITLWVDAICINQDDLIERAQQVAIMNEVYRRARKVIIWLGEETPQTAKWFRWARRFGILATTGRVLVTERHGWNSEWVAQLCRMLRVFCGGFPQTRILTNF